MTYSLTPFRINKKLSLRRVALVPKKDERRPEEFAAMLGSWLQRPAAQAGSTVAVAGQMEPPELRRHLEPAPDGRLRYPAAARAEMYGEMAQALGGNTVVALCKEPQEVWELAGLTYNGCNCTE